MFLLLKFAHLSVFLAPKSLSISFCRNLPSDVSPLNGERLADSTMATAPKRISVFIMTPLLDGKNRRNGPTLYHWLECWQPYRERMHILSCFKNRLYQNKFNSTFLFLPPFVELRYFTRNPHLLSFIPKGARITLRQACWNHRDNTITKATIAILLKNRKYWFLIPCNNLHCYKAYDMKTVFWQ